MQAPRVPIDQRYAEAQRLREQYVATLAQIDARRAALEAETSGSRLERTQVALASLAGDSASQERLKSLSVAAVEASAILDALAAARAETERRIRFVDAWTEALRREREAEVALARLPAMRVAVEIIDRAAPELAKAFAALREGLEGQHEGARLWEDVRSRLALEETWQPSSVRGLIEAQIAVPGGAWLEQMRSNADQAQTAVVAPVRRAHTEASAPLAIAASSQHQRDQRVH